MRTLIDHLPIGWAGRLALQRLLSQWRSLLTIIAGTLLGAAVGALVPLYTAAVSQVSMVEHLNQLPAQDIHFAAQLSFTAGQHPQQLDQQRTAYDATFRQIVARHLDAFPAWAHQIVNYAETSALAVDPPAEINANGESIIPNPTTRAYIAYYVGWQDAINLVSGRLPQDKPQDDANADIEVVIPLAAQNELGLQLNDILVLDQGGPSGGWPSSRNIRAVVVGVASLPEPLSPLQRAYFREPSPLRLLTKVGNFEAEYAMLTTENTLLRVVKEFIPDTATQFGWRLIFDHTRLPFPRSGAARQALFDMEAELNNQFSPQNGATGSLNYSQTTKLIDWQFTRNASQDNGILLGYERSVRTLDAPFGLLLLQVGALVLFFLMVTAALVRRGERREIAMLQSRGARDSSIVLVRGIEALIICVLAALIAPVLSQQLLILITPFFARYENLPLILTSAEFIYATIAAFVTFIALMLTLRPVLRMPLITSGGITLRGEKQAWWQKYYLDVLLVVLGIAALWRLVGRSNTLFTTTAGTRTTDPFLLLAPALLFLGLGSILLRLFPVITGLAARILSAGRGLVGSLTTWQLSREPVHYGRITFLLALAIGIGWFATSFRATVVRSQNDQAQYTVGTDVRYKERDIALNSNRAQPITAYTQAPEVESASVGWRQLGVNMQPDPQQLGFSGNLLAIDSDTFVQSVYWRPDLGVIHTPRPAGQPITLPERGRELSLMPRSLNLWAFFQTRQAFGQYYPDLDRLLNRTQLSIRLLDANETWLFIPFHVKEVEYLSTPPLTPGIAGGNAFVSSGWAYLEADLSSLTYQPVAPLRLVSIAVQHRGRFQNGERDLQLTVAGLTGTPADGNPTAIELINHPDWEFLPDSGAPAEGYLSAYLGDGRHGRGMTMIWSQSASYVRVGMNLNYPTIERLPAVVSQSLAQQLALTKGQTFQLRDVERVPLSLVVADVQKYYPTLYDSYLVDNRWVRNIRFQPFIVTDRDALMYVLNRRPSATLYADEVWLKTKSNVDTTAVVNQLQQADHRIALLNTQTLSDELSNLQNNPLSLGLLGLMFLAFIIAMTLSIVGLLTYATLTANARRGEFAVLRALGLSSNRVIAQLALEQIFVVVIGTSLGAILGAVLSDQVVPRLALDTANQVITPPFIVQVETNAILQFGLVILIVLAIVLGVSLLLVRGMSLTRTLRLGEE